METSITLTKTIECTYADLVAYYQNNPSKRHLTIEQAIANVLWLKKHGHSI